MNKSPHLENLYKHIFLIPTTSNRNTCIRYNQIFDTLYLLIKEICLYVTIKKTYYKMKKNL